MKTRIELLQQIRRYRKRSRDPDTLEYKKNLYLNRIRLLQWVLGVRLDVDQPKNFPRYSTRRKQAGDRIAFYKERMIRIRILHNENMS